MRNDTGRTVTAFLGLALFSVFLLAASLATSPAEQAACGGAFAGLLPGTMLRVVAGRRSFAVANAALMLAGAVAVAALRTGLAPGELPVVLGAGLASAALCVTAVELLAHGLAAPVRRGLA